MVGIVRANGELCCVRNNAVDVALCFSALDHCVEPDRVLANMASALRPGGCALIDLRNCNAWHKMVFRWLPACMTQRLRLAEDSHDWHFSPRDLARRLEAVGFHEIQLYDIFYLDIFCRLLPGRVLDWGLSLLGEQLCTAALRVADRLCHFIAPHCGGNFIALARKLN